MVKKFKELAPYSFNQMSKVRKGKEILSDKIAILFRVLMVS